MYVFQSLILNVDKIKWTEPPDETAAPRLEMSLERSNS